MHSAVAKIFQILDLEAVKHKLENMHLVIAIIFQISNLEAVARKLEKKHLEDVTNLKV